MAKNFKLYSTYCALHLRLNRLFDLQQNNETIKDFFAACNPSGQHASSFESYLIKPVQRLVKYPLFLQQMLNYSKKDETNHIVSLRKSIKLMMKISKYVNSMQQLYEEFGQSFESIAEQYYEEHKTVIERWDPRLSFFEFRPCSWTYRICKPMVNWIGWISTCSCARSIAVELAKSSVSSLPAGVSSSLENNRITNHRQDIPRSLRRIGETCCSFQNESLHQRMKKSIPDRFIRFLPLAEVKVDLLETDGDRIRHWQLTHTDESTRLKTLFRFANK